jgi:hypothetical protein
MRTHWWARLSFAFALLFIATAAMAEPSEKDQEKGKKMAVDAFKLYQEEKYTEALAKFQEAEKFYPSANVIRMEGYSLKALKRYIEAIEVLEKALKTEFKPLMPAEAEEVEDHLKALKGMIAVVTIKSDVKGATVRIDNAAAKPLPLEITLMPGSHHFVTEAPGRDAVDESRDVKAGPVTLTFNPPAKKVEVPKVVEKPIEKPVEKPKPPSKPINLFGGWFPQQRNIGIGVAGAGVVAGATALGLGIYGLSLNAAVKKNIDAHNANYDAGCVANTVYCQNDIELINHDGKRAAQYRNAAMVTGLVGVGLFVVGGTFVAFAPDGPFAPAKPKDGKDKVALDCGAAPTGGGVSMGCSGRF